jgi:hypothetical protein
MLAVAVTVALVGCSQEILEWRLDTSRRPEEVMAAAQAGDARAAFLAYQLATTNPERRKWICIAANRDFPDAQVEIARLHWRLPGISPSPFTRDAFRAYVWAVIAITRDQPLESMVRRLNRIIKNGERWRATVLAVAWKPDPSQCDNMEDSEYFNVGPGEQDHKIHPGWALPGFIDAAVGHSGPGTTPIMARGLRGH